MKNFSKAFSNEIIKINSGYTILKLAIAILVFFIILTFSFNLIIETMGDYLGGIGNLNEQELDMQIAQVESQIELYNDKDTIGVADNSLYQLKTRLALLNYIKDNNVNLANKTFFGSMNFDSAGFITTIMDVASTIIVIFAVVMVITTFHSEKRNGTLKMQMIRPVSRTTMLLSKMLSIWVMSILVYFVFVVLAQVVSIIKFGANTKDVIYVLNAKTVGEMSFIGYMSLKFFADILEVWFYMQLAYFISSLLWKKESCMGIMIIILLLGPMLDQLLNFLYVGYAGFFNNIDYLSALSVESGPGMKYANLYSMLSFTIVYQVLMTAYTFIHFKKCEIA